MNLNIDRNALIVPAMYPRWQHTVPTFELPSLVELGDVDAHPPAAAPAPRYDAHVNRHGSVSLVSSELQLHATPPPASKLGFASEVPVPAPVRATPAVEMYAPQQPPPCPETAVLENLMVLFGQLPNFFELEKMAADVQVEKGALDGWSGELEILRDDLDARASALRHVQRTTNPLVVVNPTLSAEELLLLRAIDGASASASLQRYVAERWEDDVEAAERIDELRAIGAQLLALRHELCEPDTSELRGAALHEKLPLFLKWKQLIKQQHEYASEVRETLYAAVARRQTGNEIDDVESMRSIAQQAQRYVLPCELIERAARLRDAAKATSARAEDVRRETAAAEGSVRALQGDFSRVRAAEQHKHHHVDDHAQISTAAALNLVAYRERLVDHQDQLAHVLDAESYRSAMLDGVDSVWRPELESIRAGARQKLEGAQDNIAAEAAAAQVELGKMIADGFDGVLDEALARSQRASADNDAAKRRLRALGRELAAVSEATTSRAPLVQGDFNGSETTASASTLFSRDGASGTSTAPTTESSEICVRVQRRMRTLWAKANDPSGAVMFLSRLELAMPMTAESVRLYEEITAREDGAGTSTDGNSEVKSQASQLEGARERAPKLGASVHVSRHGSVSISPKEY
jgi:hypothetical protein